MTVMSELLANEGHWPVFLDGILVFSDSQGDHEKGTLGMLQKQVFSLKRK